MEIESMRYQLNKHTYKMDLLQKTSSDEICS